MVKAQIPRFSVGRSPRFEILSHNEATLTSILPLTYAASIVDPRKNKYKQVSQGFGTKYTYKTSKEDEVGPGPIYQTEYQRSIKQTLDHIEPRRNSTFGCDKDQRAKVIYHGQEKSYYGMESPGPGAYGAVGSVSKYLTLTLFKTPNCHHSDKVPNRHCHG